MSTTVIQQGYIAVLTNPIMEEEEREEISERLYDDSTVLQINYEGTLLCSDINRSKPYGEREFSGDLFIVGNQSNTGREEFIQQAKEAGLFIDESTIQPYTCVYYNGSDSPLSLLGKSEFLEGK